MPSWAHCCWRYSASRFDVGVSATTTVNENPFGNADFAIASLAFFRSYVKPFAAWAS